ncbi:TetR/AcrR family transcriptional regulator [Streptomyces sp. NPDC088387]|uniref:TetR/AcrR family transcriptional regulator n=1 Tax=Streptomyces sp. NPDC088387 TaxID=3365859 RepID=UPI0037F324E0
MTVTGTATGGTVSPRQRIMRAASSLFYSRGINSTSISDVADRASVSKRTLYQLFLSKDVLVAAYLETGVGYLEPGNNEGRLNDPSLSPREQLLALFDRPPEDPHFRGCPYHNAAVELSDRDHPGLPLVIEHKRQFLQQVVDAARRAGAREPDRLGRQLAVLFEGAMALTASLDDSEAFEFARTAAEDILRHGLPRDHPGQAPPVHQSPEQ